MSNPGWEPDAARLSALAEFAAGAGHEINNPLATIVGRVQQLLKDETDPQRRYSLSVIAGQAYRIRDMIGDVMTFARPPAAHPVTLDFTTWLTQQFQTFVSEPGSSGEQTQSEIAAGLVAAIDPAQWSVVVHELLRNARQALPETGGRITLSARREQNDIVLQVTDTGCGFTDEAREHAFDPFYSGRQAGRGLGFGLCKVWQIVRQHQGTIQIERNDEGRTLVTVRWPGSP
jgi:signal transduction histidine kinase